MHFRRWASLGIILVLSVNVFFDAQPARGQTAQVDYSRSLLVQAFELVQQADEMGAPPDQIASLANNLNLALLYEQEAALLSANDTARSNSYASQSADVSNATSVQALSATNAAERQTFWNQISIYSLAIVAGLGSALFVLEVHRLENLLRRTRLRRMRLD